MIKHVIPLIPVLPVLPVLPLLSISLVIPLSYLYHVLQESIILPEITARYASLLLAPA